MANIIETTGEAANAGRCVFEIREIWVARKLEEKGQVQLCSVQVQCSEPASPGQSPRGHTDADTVGAAG